LFSPFLFRNLSKGRKYEFVSFDFCHYFKEDQPVFTGFQNRPALP